MSLLLRHVWQWLRQAIKILHQLWLEVTGAVFLGLAALGGISAWKEWRAYQDGGPVWKPAMAISFFLMMAAFGIYSFMKARRIR